MCVGMYAEAACVGGVAQSMYDASVPRFGVMGLLTAWVAGLPEPCYKPPVNTSNGDVRTLMPRTVDPRTILVQ